MIDVKEIRKNNIVKTNNKFIEIRHILENCVNDKYKHYYKFTELYPITLTNDMFELLGFKLECEKIINLSEYIKNINGYNIRIGTYSNSIDKDFSIHIDNRDCDTILRADMQYLHQLQNHIYSTTYEELDITNIIK